MSKLKIYALAEIEARRLIEECFPSEVQNIYEIKSDNISFDVKGTYFKYVERILKENGYNVINRYGPYFKLAR